MTGEHEARDHVPFSGHARELFNAAAALAEAREQLASELHLLTALISHPDGGACRFLEVMGIDVRWLRSLRDGGGLLDVAAIKRPWRQQRMPW